jgi:hypothetical protein
MTHGREKSQRIAPGASAQTMNFIIEGGGTSALRPRSLPGS